MKLTKKCMSAILIVAMAMGLVSPALAATDQRANVLNNGSKNDNPIENKNNYMLFEEVFNGDQDDRTAVPDMTASYNYELYENTADAISPYSAQVEISFDTGTNMYSFIAQGDVDTIALDNGLTYLTGPLYGSVIVRETNYQVTVGFNKVMEREGVSFCVTMVPKNGNVDQTLSFSFGDKVLTADILSALLPNKNTSEIGGEHASDVSAMAATTIGTATAIIPYYSTGVKENIKLDTSAKEIGIEVTSYTENAKKTVAYAYGASVLQINYTLKRDSGSVKLVGITDDTDQNVSVENTDKADRVSSVIIKGINYFNKPIATFLKVIKPAIKDHVVNLYVPKFTDDYGRLYLRFGLGADAVNFDTYSCPVVFSYSGSGSNKLTAYATIEYAVLGDAGYTYVTTNTATKTFTKTL